MSEFNSFETVQEYLDTKETMFFCLSRQDEMFFSLHPKHNPFEGLLTMDECIRKFFYLNMTYHTYLASEAENVDMPYFKIYSYRGKRRSIGDIYRTLKYYLPNTHIKDVHTSLCNLNKENFVYSFICHDINKRVWRTDVGKTRYFDDFHSDEFRLSYEGMNTHGNPLYSSKNALNFEI